VGALGEMRGAVQHGRAGVLHAPLWKLSGTGVL